MKIGNLLSTKLWFALACIWVPVSSSGAQNGTGAVWERKPSAGNLGDGNPHLQLVGHIQAAEASCPDASRQSSAALRVQGGPSQLLTSSLSCHFLPKEAIAPLRQLVRGQVRGSMLSLAQFGGTLALRRGPPLSSATWDEASSFRWLLNTPSSPANISKLMAYSPVDIPRQMCVTIPFGPCGLERKLLRRNRQGLSGGCVCGPAGIDVLEAGSGVGVFGDVPSACQCRGPPAHHYFGTPAELHSRWVAPQQVPLERRAGPAVRDTSGQPLVGPPAGNTLIHIQGQGLTERLTCTFANSSYAVTVNATVESPTRAHCATPAWRIATGEGWAAVRLGVLAGRCLHYLQYTYLLEPLLIKVEPSRAARYGALPLRVHLEDPLPKLAPEQARPKDVKLLIDLFCVNWNSESYASQVTAEIVGWAVEQEEAGLKPLLMLEGAGGNGSDIVVPARLAANRRSLVGVLPAEQGPVRGGVHILRLSLDGQQFQRRGKPSVTSRKRDFKIEGLRGASVQAVTIEGPTVSVANNSAFVFLPPGTSTPTTVELELVGAASRLPVTALLEVSQRSLSPMGYTEPDGPQEFVLGAEQVRWEAGESGPRNVTLFWEGLGGVPAAANLSMGALVLTIANVTNADINPLKDSAVVSGMPEDALAYAFTLVPNQVVYQGDPLRIPINVSNAHLRTPTVLLYNISATAGPFPSYLPRASLQGELRWDPVEDDEVAEIQLPHQLDSCTPRGRVPLDAFKGPSNITAAHIFGVRPGQCPPGTYRRSETFMANQGYFSDTMWLGRDDARLSAILIKGANGSSFDISSSFNPDVAEYGTAVPPDTSSATLCLRPMQGWVRAWGGIHRNITLIFRQPFRLLFWGIASSSSGCWFSDVCPPWFRPGNSVPLAGSGPPVADAPAAARARRSSGVSAMVSDRSPDAGAMCEKHTYQLPLDYGQNSFIIRITTTSGLDHEGHVDRSKPAVCILMRGLEDRRASPSSSRSDAYTLSIVRLANPEHAVLAELNVTDSSHASYAVCSDDPDAERPPTDDCCARMRCCLHEAAPGCLRQSDCGAKEGEGVPECEPNTSMWLNVSSSVEWVLLQPWLRWPHLEGVRVEVAGQVLSKGGDVGADQLEDTGAEPKMRCEGGTGPSLAEDGVTSLRYYLNILRDNRPEWANSTALGFGEEGDPIDSVGAAGLVLAAEAAGSTAQDPLGLGLPHTIMTQRRSFPSRSPPRHLLGPALCWASTQVDADSCQMCGPGSFAPLPSSPACLACPNGTYASSWGSTHCNHCIIGTYAPHPGSRLCLMCPDNMTNLEDGSEGCGAPIQPGTNLTMRFAVIVSFGVYLNGASLDEIATKRSDINCRCCSRSCRCPHGDRWNVSTGPGQNATSGVGGCEKNSTRRGAAGRVHQCREGARRSEMHLADGVGCKQLKGGGVGVNASSEEILGHLIRTDTADAFNISVGDVEVTGISQIGRRMLYVNVSATLGVDVPPGASVEDVDTGPPGCQSECGRAHPAPFSEP
eukprot:jgi/Botrbrau1/804/Bobra.0352s0001.1